MKIAIISLGCPKNQVDADVFCHALIKDGHVTVADPGEADIIIINTCGFIESAKTEAIENILMACQYKQENPDLKVIVTGCLAERYKQQIIQEIPEVDAVVGIGSNAGVYSSDGGPFYVMRDFFGALTPSLAKANMGDGYPQMVLTVVTMFVGLFLIVLFAHKKIKGSVLLGMLCASGIYWAGEAIFLHTNPFAALKGASFVPAFGDMAATTLFKFDFAALGEIGWFTVVTLVITFCIIDMFDTIGTLVGTASRAGMVDKDGNMPRMREALLADAVGTVTGACTGTSTVTTFVESASGVEAGGRTGLTALTTGLLFLASMFLAPIAAIIPAAATSSALIYVGLLMLGGLKKIDFDDIYQSLPVAIMLISMPISGSIGHGIGLGLISYSVLKLCTGKGKDVSLLTYAISLLFLVKFFLVA